MLFLILLLELTKPSLTYLILHCTVLTYSSSEDEEDSFEYPFLNHSFFAEKVMKEIPNLVKGISPRWTFLGRIRNPTNTSLNVTCTVLIVVVICVNNVELHSRIRCSNRT
jgi:hypothetical protein